MLLHLSSEKNAESARLNIKPGNFHRAYCIWLFSTLYQLVISFMCRRDDLHGRTFAIGKRGVCYHYLGGTGAQRTSRFSDVSRVYYHFLTFQYSLTFRFYVKAGNSDDIMSVKRLSYAMLSFPSLNTTPLLGPCYY